MGSSKIDEDDDDDDDIAFSEELERCLEKATLALVDAEVADNEAWEPGALRQTVMEILMGNVYIPLTLDRKSSLDEE